MKVIIARHSGLCFGVRDALALAESTARTRPVTVLGALAHNPHVQDRLRRLGAQEGRLQDDTAPTPTVLITAHGASAFQHRKWSERAAQVVDATCPLVRHAYTQLRRLVEAGFFPVVIGTPGHVEVQGLVGDYPQAIVLTDESDVERLPINGAIGVISQTTQPVDRVRRLVEIIRKSRPQCEVRFCDTVCQPTKDRQEALKELCDQVDRVVVVGGRHSQNTRHLVETAQRLGVPALSVEGPEDLPSDDWHDVETVGLTAGTSTLLETFEAVQKRLESLSAGARTVKRSTLVEA
jgi:4-hydroxy-3-methylbut-2-enyl diphosphate reductase